jgi:hypothetical protein
MYSYAVISISNQSIYMSRIEAPEQLVQKNEVERNPNTLEINGKEVPMVENVFAYIQENRAAFYDLFVDMIYHYQQPILDQIEQLAQEEQSLPTKLQQEIKDLEKITVVSNIPNFTTQQLAKTKEAIIKTETLVLEDTYSKRSDEIRGTILTLRNFERIFDDVANIEPETLDNEAIVNVFLRIFTSTGAYNQLQNAKTPIKPVSILDKTSNKKPFNINTLEDLLEQIFVVSFDLPTKDDGNVSLYNKMDQLGVFESYIINNLINLSVAVEDIPRGFFNTLNPKERIFLNAAISDGHTRKSDHKTYITISKQQQNGDNISTLINDQTKLLELIKIFHYKLWMNDRFLEIQTKNMRLLKDPSLTPQDKTALTRELHNNKAKVYTQLNLEWREKNKWEQKPNDTDKSRLVNGRAESDQKTTEHTWKYEHYRYYNGATETNQQNIIDNQDITYTPEDVLTLIQPYLGNKSEYMITRGMITDSKLNMIGKLLQIIPTLEVNGIERSIQQLFRDRGVLVSNGVTIIKNMEIDGHQFSKALKIKLNSGHRMIIYSESESVKIHLYPKGLYHDSIQTLS